MAEIVWTEAALNGLNEIVEYIALSNLPAARKLVQRVFDVVKRLEAHPQSGRIPPELGQLNYREVIANPCRVFYRIDSGKVFVVHVMRQERLLRKYLLDEHTDQPSQRD